MANVLGTLFQDIADAIRDKTGDTASMKPAEFPEKIAAIETGGGSGGGEEKTINFKCKPVTLQGKWGERVSVDFGFVPDFILVYPDRVDLSSANFLYLGMSQKFKDTYGQISAEYYTFWGSSTSVTNTNISVIEGTNTNDPLYNADETGFNFGKTPVSGDVYIFAFGLPT